MTSNKGSRIENLQLAIRRAEEAFSKYNQLTSKRNQLQEQIDQLIQRLEKLKLSHAVNPSLKLNSLIDKDNKLLVQLKDEKLTADAFLDEIEEMKADDLQTLKNELIEELCKLYPDRKARFQELENCIEQQKVKIIAWDKIKKQIAILNQLLSKIAESRKRFRAQGIMAYIFGENPNITITTQLKACELQSEELNDFLNDESVDNIFRASAQTHLNLFLVECKKRWGFKKLDNAILPFQEVFKTLENAAEAKKQKSVQELETLESQIEKWLKET